MSSNMVRVVSFVLFQLFLTCKSDGLPQWVYRVDSCPDSNNISQWISASKRLNCYNDLTSNDPNEQKRVYHCVPTSFLNETVEFCGRSIPIAPGNCPVYSNTITVSTISPIKCRDFVFGCPLELFHSKEVYRYPECLSLNFEDRCFKADGKCQTLLAIPDSTKTPIAVTTMKSSTLEAMAPESNAITTKSNVNDSTRKYIDSIL
ncbi:uncharacterized protein [Magallana gigas]|uniref:uncharacterized protein isoform X2 n=1 Tax=Magallana gigas TaxID=29159 RepID=UPI0033422B56